MTVLRVLMTVLTGFHLVFACLIGVVANFADGGSIPERIFAGLIQPVAAILLFVVIVLSFFKPLDSTASVLLLARSLKISALVLLSVQIVGGIALSVLISQEVIRGDWFLPLIFVAVPIIGAVYIATPLYHSPGADQ